MFRVGDRVVLKREHPNRSGETPKVGQEGSIISVNEYEIPDYKYQVLFDELTFENVNRDGTWFCGECHIELIDDTDEIKLDGILDIL